MNWLGVEAYSIYDNLSISEDDKKDPSRLLDTFEHYFKPEHNIFQSWYALGSKDEIVKFSYLTHNQNTRVREHLLKELTDTTSLADMLQMAHVCEGTVHSEEISKQYLESVKTVKQVDAIYQCCKSKHKGRGHRSHSRSQSRRPGCSNCGSSHPPKKCKAYGKECFHCHKKGHFSQLCHSKQQGKCPRSNVRSSSQNNRYSCRDIHEIDQSQFDDSVQFKQDSITIEFKKASQTRHTNVMFNEICSTPSLQRVLTDVHVKPIGINQSYWSKHCFKIDSGA